jgi:hypothetical protein
MAIENLKKHLILRAFNFLISPFWGYLYPLKKKAEQ